MESLSPLDSHSNIKTPRSLALWSSWCVSPEYLKVPLNYYSPTNSQVYFFSIFLISVGSNTDCMTLKWPRTNNRTVLYGWRKVNLRARLNGQSVCAKVLYDEYSWELAYQLIARINWFTLPSPSLWHLSGTDNINKSFLGKNICALIGWIVHRDPQEKETNYWPFTKKICLFSSRFFSLRKWKIYYALK